VHWSIQGGEDAVLLRGKSYAFKFRASATEVFNVHANAMALTIMASNGDGSPSRMRQGDEWHTGQPCRPVPPDTRLPMLIWHDIDIGWTERQVILALQKEPHRVLRHHPPEQPFSPAFVRSLQTAPDVTFPMAEHQVCEDALPDFAMRRQEIGRERVKEAATERFRPGEWRCGLGPGDTQQHILRRHTEAVEPVWQVEAFVPPAIDLCMETPIWSDDLNVRPHVIHVSESETHAALRLFSLTQGRAIQEHGFDPERKDMEAGLQMLCSPIAHQLSRGIEEHRVREKMRFQIGA
jgi:hypothetical protein